MATFQYDLLTEKEVKDILDGTYHVMEEIGMDVESEEAISILAEAGAKIDGNRVRIPRSLTEKALASAPEKVDIYNRNGELIMELTERNNYYGPGVTCPFFYDPYTLERRPSTKQDVVSTAIVADGLKNVDFLMSLCMIEDETPVLADVHEIHAMLKTSPMPILGWAFNTANLKDIAEMAFAVAGSKENFAKKPFLIMYSEPTTPLTHSKEALDKLIFLAKNDIPCVYSPGMTFGGTAPVTLAAALTIGLADVFTGLVVSQLVKPGASMILSSNGGVLDLRSLQGAYGSPEALLVDAAGTQILRSVGIPSFGLAGATDSKSVDAQASMEVTSQLLLYSASGANLIHDLGMIDIGMTGSIDLMVFCDEVISYVKRLQQGFTVDDEALAFDVVKKVGPGNNYIAEKHTYQNFRKELYIPELGLRSQYDLWAKAGSKTMLDLTHERTLDLLANHKPESLDSEVAAKLDVIMEQAEKRVK
jgi:trimethylamine--corrinoid protein Co-methyltransferase